jgi:hypothetical protein
MIDTQMKYFKFIVVDFFVCFSFLLVLATVFVVNKDLANSTVSGKYFWFYASMALLTIVAVPAAIIKQKERFRFTLTDLLLLLFCCAALAVTLIYTGRLNTKCYLLVFLGIFYCYLRIFLSSKGRLIRYLLVLFFMLTGLVEAVWGLRQLYGFTASQHYMFKTTGSFFNPGPYSGWLAIVFPMALGYVVLGFTKKIVKEKFVFNHYNITAFLKTDLPKWINSEVNRILFECKWRKFGCKRRTFGCK